MKDDFHIRVKILPPIRSAFKMAAMEMEFKDHLISKAGSKFEAKRMYDEWVKTHNPYADWCVIIDQARQQTYKGRLLPSEERWMLETIEFVYNG